MAKLLTVVVVIALVAVGSAEPPRSNRRLRNRSRFLARQEILEDVPAQTPYPPAGNIPDVAFDLPADESSVFGDKAVIGSPDQTYGPPEAEAVPQQPQEDFGVDADAQSQRFTSIRGNGRFIQQGNRARAALLRKASPLQVAAPLQIAAPLQLAAPLQVAPQQQFLQPQQPQPQLLAQPILLADGRVVYSIVA